MANDRHSAGSCKNPDLQTFATGGGSSPLLPEAVAGQRELKRRATSHIGARPQAAAMRLDDPPTDGQSHAGSLRFGGEERLENAFGFLSRKPDARVTHRNQELTIFGSLRRDAQFTAFILLGLDAIEHEVHQYLLQLHTIRCRRWKRRVKVGAD